MSIKKYKDFILERNLTYSENKKLINFSNIDLNMPYDDILYKIFNRLLHSDMITNEDRKCVYQFIGSYVFNEDFKYILNESFWDKLKDRFPKASEVSNIIKGRGEEILKKVIDKAKDAMQFVNSIISGLKELIFKFFKYAKDWTIKQFKNGDLKKKMKNLNDKEKSGIKKDLKTGLEVSKWYKENFTTNVISQAKKNMANFVSKDQNPIAENISINEGKNVISTLIHGLESIPPFSWLHKLAKAGESGANQLIELMSKLTNKLGGPKFELPVIAALIGIVLEQFIKTDVGHWLLHLVGSGTGLGIAIKGIKMVALSIAVIVALDEVFGNKIMSNDSKDADSSEENADNIDNINS